MQFRSMQESLLATTFTSGFPDAARKTSLAVPETKRQVLTLARVVLDHHEVRTLARVVLDHHEVRLEGRHGGFGHRQ